jgi:hypothetical protein
MQEAPSRPVGGLVIEPPPFGLLCQQSATDQAALCQTFQSCKIRCLLFPFLFRQPVRFIIPDGDVNNDGVVNASDYSLALNIAVGIVPVTPLAHAHGDVAPLVNGVPAPNGAIDISDTLQINRKVSGLVTWNTICTPTQQGLLATQQAVTSTTTAASITIATAPAAPVTQNTSACSNYYKIFDEQALMGILDMLNRADSNGKDVVTNKGHSMVARKITSCDIDLELYNDAKQKKLLCVERVSTCVTVK